MVHCEKTMWVLWAGIIGVVGLVLLYFFGGGIRLNIYLVYIIIIAFVGGAFGSLYYRIEQGKDPIWKIWGGD